MSAEFVKFTDDTLENTKKLAEGVKGIKCVYVGSPSGVPVAHQMVHLTEVLEALENIPPIVKFGGCEVYANQYANYFVRDVSEKVIGFIRYTPEQETHTQFWSAEGFWRSQLAQSKEDKSILPILAEAEKIPLTGHEMNDIEGLLRQAYRAGANSWFGEE